MEEFGSIMKQERIKKGLSITELSKMTGVDIKTISFIERGLRRKPTLETLFKLANILECITFDMMKSIGYTEQEIVIFLCDDDDEEDYEEEDLSEYKYGFHIALHGYGKVLASDIDEDCRKTYEANYGIKPTGDILIRAPLPWLIPIWSSLLHLIKLGEKALLKYGLKSGL